MAEYADVNGIQMWYDERGDGKPLVLLHGGLSDSRDFAVDYSAGGTVALRVAMRRPDLVDRLVLISAAFHRDGMIVRPAVGVEPPAQLVAAYAAVSLEGAEHLPVVIAKNVRSVNEEPGLTPTDLAGVTRPALVMTADDDIVTLEHTLALYRGLAEVHLCGLRPLWPDVSPTAGRPLPACWANRPARLPAGRR